MLAFLLSFLFSRQKHQKKKKKSFCHSSCSVGCRSLASLFWVCEREKKKKSLWSWETPYYTYMLLKREKERQKRKLSIFWGKYGYIGFHILCVHFLYRAIIIAYHHRPISCHHSIYIRLDYILLLLPLVLLLHKTMLLVARSCSQQNHERWDEKTPRYSILQPFSLFSLVFSLGVLPCLLHDSIYSPHDQSKSNVRPFASFSPAFTAGQ